MIDTRREEKALAAMMSAGNERVAVLATEDAFVAAVAATDERLGMLIIDEAGGEATYRKTVKQIMSFRFRAREEWEKDWGEPSDEEDEDLHAGEW